jgi:hypothetical protein
MENRKISYLVRNFLSIINLVKILTNDERFKNKKNANYDDWNDVRNLRGI